MSTRLYFPWRIAVASMFQRRGDDGLTPSQRHFMAERYNRAMRTPLTPEQHAAIRALLEKRRAS